MRPDFHSPDALPLDARQLQTARRQVEALHELGARATFEFVLEVISETPPARRAWIARRLETYAALDAGTLAACGGDQFAPTPTLRLVAGDD